MAEIEFFVEADGSEPVREYVEQLVRQGRKAEAAAMLRYVDLLEDHGPELAGLGTGVSRLIDREARIFELRPGSHRVAFAVVDGTYVLLHAWRKRSQKLDGREVGRARRRLERRRG